ncbi:MAG: cation transporter [Candidatus Omnitrophica bacterium]|nr:cation transporter [Candidatus Omnitrophota bacterium]
MKVISRWIVSRCIRDHAYVRDAEVRSRYGSLEGGMSIVVNLALFAVKLVLGIAVNSVALMADAVHTLSDSATSVVVIVGFRIAQKPSDKEHPFGHGRMEPIATLIVSILLFVAGVELFKSSVQSVLKPEVATASFWVIGIVTATILVKEFMARFSFDLGEMIDSSTLKADALHHRTDAISTVLVVVALVASRFGIGWLDGVMGAGVSLIIFYSAYEIAKDAIDPLLGQAPPRGIIREIEKQVKTYPGALGVHDVIYHQYGQIRVISLHLEVSDKEPVMKLHELSEAIEDDLGRIMDAKVVVHIDPINRDHPLYAPLEKALREIIAGNKRVAGFHEMRIVGTGADKRCSVIFDMTLEDKVEMKAADGIIREVTEEIKRRFQGIKVVIKAEPKYALNLSPAKDESHGEDKSR